MKISELITKLESLKEKHGDNTLYFNVKDSYSIFGERIHTNLSCGENTNLPSDWCDIITRENTSTITFHISENEIGKKSKITYRK